jgi:hypothetical protein
MAYQEQVAQIDNKIAALELKKTAAENLNLTDNAAIIRKQIDDLQNQKLTIQNDLSNQNSASGQTAEQKANNDLPATTPGAGQGNNNSNPSPTLQESSLSSNESTKLAAAAKNEETVENSGSNTDTPTNQGAVQSEQTAEETTSGPLQVYISGVGEELIDYDSNTVQSVPFQFLKNKLHDFTGYTYKITLFLLTTEDYQALNSEPDTFQPKYTLISSGGSLPNYNTADSKTTWHKDFQEDFYFENLSIGTVVNLNSRSKASNIIDISFQIIEPHGMTLLDRLFSACQTTAKCPNYIDQPYMLQVDFLANPDDANKFGIKGHVIDQKRVAIKFIEFKIKPGVSGTVYNVKAIPYNHIGFLESAGSVPINLSVEAETVNDYFDSRKDLLLWFDQSAAKDQERQEAALNNLKIVEATPDELERAKARLRAEFTYTTKSFPAAYNTYYKNIAYKQGIFEEPLYQIAFNIDPEIGDTKIVNPNKFNSSQTVMTGRLENYTSTTANGADPNFKNKGVFNISYGSSVIQIIDRVIASSDYIKNQVRKAEDEQEKLSQQDTTTNQSNGRTATNDQQKKNKEFKPTDWYKIIPAVTIGKYDNLARAYSKFITYSIMPFSAANFYHPDFKFTKINAKKSVRTFEYLYTGRNQDIISLDIDFDATFVVGMTTFTKNLERTNTYPGADQQVLGKQNAGPQDNRPPSYLPFRSMATPADSQYTGQTNRSTAEDFSVASVSRSLYSAYPRGDMLNIKMKIVGDPSFIKQDDMLYHPMQTGYAAAITTSGGSNSPPINVNTGQILFDLEQVFVQILVKGTTDIDDQIGIVNKKLKLSNDQETNGTFSGLYMLTRVQSDFSKGKFEQTLELVRVPDDAVELENEPGTEVQMYVVPPTDGSEYDKNNVRPTEPLIISPLTTIDGITARDPGLIAARDQVATLPVPGIFGSGTSTINVDIPTSAAPVTAGESTQAPQQTIG